MSFCIKNVQKREKQNFGFFDKLPYLYGKPFVAQKFHKTKNAGRRKFCSCAERCARRGKKLSKIKALSLTVKKLWLKNLKNEYP